MYRDYLQQRYNGQIISSATQWPPLPVARVFKLALIQKENIQRGKISDDLVRFSLAGNIETILQQRSNVEIKDIFSFCESENTQKFVLIEGAPGSGKSTLALHICQEWADGKLFQEFDVVILVKLRDPHVRMANTTADLLPCVDKTMANQVESIIKTHYGKGVLWVLDGWDELPTDLPSDSIINKLIQPFAFQENPLLKCAVIMTSRPSSSAKLYPLVSSRLEVLGFTPGELEHYFKECLKGDIKALHTLLERIRENPVVEGSCYLPLNASIVAHVFLSGDHTLPTSNHGIFISVVKNFLKRFLQDKLGKTTAVGDIISQDIGSLPLEIQKPFSHLCRLAYHGVKNDIVTFTDNDLTSLSISKDVSKIGLLQSVSSIICDGHQVYYCFLHLSIQELLAAIYISHTSPKQQISVFQELFGNPRFSAVFQFYAGITKLRVCRTFLSKLPQFLCPVPASILDLIKTIIKNESANDFKPKPILVSLIHCLYEAEDPSLCVLVADLLDHELNLGNSILSPLDCLSVGYFLSVIISGCRFRAYLTFCSIDDDGCKFLIRGLHKHIHFQSEVTAQLTLHLSGNIIHREGIYHIAEFLKNTNTVRELSLSYNTITESGLKSLCEVLLVNNTLEVIYLRGCLLDIASCGKHLFQLLNMNTSLTKLDLSGNKVTNCYQLASGLINNKTLKTLDLSNCGLTDRCIIDLSDGLNNYIEVLNISKNSLITTDGLNALTKRLTTVSELKCLKIPKNLKSTQSTELNEINEERRRKGLRAIELSGI